MRRTNAPSEIGRLTAPVVRALDEAWQRMHWWVILMLVLYAGSGTTMVKADEVAVVLRWGRLVGPTPALQEHGPGMLFAFPRPVDRVVRVPVKHVYEVAVETLAPIMLSEDESNPTTLDPVTQGYALTGDQNIVHASVVARYRIRDAAEWAFRGPQADAVLRVEVTAAMVRSLGEMVVDRVLADGRKELIARATARAQAGLDACQAGLELTSLELTSLSPPVALVDAFTAVQSAFIGAETKRKAAQAYAESAIPAAQALVDTTTQGVRGASEGALATARGEAAAFASLDREYRLHTAVVRERLYRDAIERAISRSGHVQWVPPPIGGTYHGLRITVPSSVATPTPGFGEGDR